ncbi:Aspartate beta-hydroxylase domain-containing protein 2 [Armadillidium nasatum]|uniref:Aspartate beta-hydroxylase domain-containing protein 2 n=1 Tax=Armadillidium nasatum TaxID=96803 RepID=A0A5N5SHR5_9CRUS|nr:Aspartate beta-hydroxylase domain-containing protein 2 [Armadillidium nasatum]
MDIITSCCTAIYNNLPEPNLPFVRALALGLISSFVVLALMHQRYYKTSFKKSVCQLFQDMFVSVPKLDHSEFMHCKNKTCTRCQKSEELIKAVIEAWEKMELANKASTYKRIAFGIEKMSFKSRNESSDYGRDKSMPTIFSMDLEMRPLSIWTHLDCYKKERDLLDTNFSIIKDEFQQIFKFFLNGGIEGWKLNDIPSGHWCIFPIIDQGIVKEENCIKCPNTSALLGSLPSLMKNCVFGNAFFSLLYPNSRIEPHYGPTNTRLRCHLGLQIPEECWLEVDGTQIRWKEGEVVIFDDSFEHSAYFGFSPNVYDDTPRVVLVLDFWHPNISTKEKDVLQKLFKPEYF